MPVRPTANGTVFVYALVDPAEGCPRYVGASGDPESRVLHHLNESGKGVSAKHYWLRSLRRSGRYPMIEILEATDEARWQECERAWVDRFRQEGYPLTNWVPGTRNPRQFPYRDEER